MQGMPVVLKSGEGVEEKNRQCGIRAKPTPKFPRAQSHEVTSAEKNSFLPPLIPIREKKKNEPCLGRKQNRGFHKLLRR